MRSKCIPAVQRKTLGLRAPPPSALIYGFFGGEKNIKLLLPATTIENMTRANLFRKPSYSSILMAINALIAIICSIHLLPLAKF